MLQHFFDYVSKYQGNSYLHWNMRDANYGFQAIEHRFRVLHDGNHPVYIVDDSNKADLSRLIQDIYGSNYIDDPKMETLLYKNNIQPLDFLPGKQEAEAFENREFAALHLSTLRKVDVISNLAQRANENRLVTNTGWWEMNGGNPIRFLQSMSNNPYVVTASYIVGFAGLAVGVWGNCTGH